MAHPTQSLCTLRARRRRRPRNTRYRAPATAYPDRSLTGRTTPAFLAHKQSMSGRQGWIASSQVLLGRKSLKNGVILPTSSLKLSSKAGRCLIHRSQLAMTETGVVSSPPVAALRAMPDAVALRPHPEERPLGRVSKDGREPMRGVHPSRRPFPLLGTKSLKNGVILPTSSLK